MQLCKSPLTVGMVVVTNDTVGLRLWNLLWK